MPTIPRTAAKTAALRLREIWKDIHALDTIDAEAAANLFERLFDRPAEWIETQRLTKLLRDIRRDTKPKLAMALEWMAIIAGAASWQALCRADAGSIAEKPDAWKPTWIASQDDKPVFCGSSDQCWTYVLRHQGQSIDYALKWGGWKIDQVEDPSSLPIPESSVLAPLSSEVQAHLDDMIADWKESRRVMSIRLLDVTELGADFKMPAIERALLPYGCEASITQIGRDRVIIAFMVYPDMSGPDLPHMRRHILHAAQVLLASDLVHALTTFHGARVNPVTATGFIEAGILDNPLPLGPDADEKALYQYRYPNGRIFDIRQQEDGSFFLSEFRPTGILMTEDADGKQHFAEDSRLKTLAKNPNTFHSKALELKIDVEGICRAARGYSSDSIYHPSVKQVAIAILNAIKQNHWYDESTSNKDTSQPIDPTRNSRTEPTIEFLETTAEDLVLRFWMVSRFGYYDGKIIVAYGSRADAMVKPNDLVNRQVVLSDGRLVRCDTESPRRGQPHFIYVTVERPKASTP